MKPETALVLLGEEHSGRDEMNLAGNPFALLRAASRAGQSIINYDFDRTLPNGRVVKASWEVNGHATLGLPGPNEELLYLVLLQITRELANGKEWPSLVNFSRLDVLKRMGWADDATSYRTLDDCFTRLTNVTINAKHAFWSARSKMPYVAVSFHLLDDFGMAAEPRGRKSQSAIPLSWFRWNEILHESFLAGNVRSLALDFVLSLELPTTRRLFRLLELFRNSHKPPRREFEIGVMKLKDRLGMTDYKFPSKVKEKLVGAHEELLANGYLAEVKYQKNVDEEMAIYRFSEAFSQIEPSQSSPETAIEAPSRPVKAPFGSETTIYPQEAFSVWNSLSEAEREKLRILARADIEPIFWDRLERPDSPMALVLWELVAEHHATAYAAELVG